MKFNWFRNADRRPRSTEQPRGSSVPGQADAGLDRSPDDWQIEVFFDGDCPLCTREIGFLRRRDRRRQIRFTDIAASDFRASDYGLAWDEFMSEIHGRLADGTWVRGVEVFRRLYAAIGWTSVVRISRLPIISGLLDRGYRLFARNRLRWTRRCATGNATCKVESRGLSEDTPTTAETEVSHALHS